MRLNEENLKEIVEIALRSKAPDLHRSLTANGELDEFRSLRTDAGMETCEYLTDQATGQSLMEPNARAEYMERVQKLMRLQNEASRAAIEQATEFADEAED